ncbi:MAG TPA: type II/IV secretion system protein, partial [Phycisphaerales bacterium]|nr:type II/IV secretion system protein [Phycisphaerales bacterium]
MAARKDDKPAGRVDAVTLVSDVLAQAVARGASDVHFEPTGRGLTIRYRLDGELKTIEELPSIVSDNVLTRLKVLGQVLTYRNDIPQEGRIPVAEAIPGTAATEVTDMRLAVFPTI